MNDTKKLIVKKIRLANEKKKFAEEFTWMANKHMKGCSTVLVTRTKQN